MKKYFHFKLSPSKQKYAAEKEALQSALEDIENKKHRLFQERIYNDGLNHNFDDELSLTDSTTAFSIGQADDKFRYRQLKTRPLTSNSKPSTLSFPRPSTVNDSNVMKSEKDTVATEFYASKSSIPSAIASETFEDVTNSRTSAFDSLKRRVPDTIEWLEKDIMLHDDKLGYIRLGIIEVYRGSTLSETRKIITQFVQTSPKNYTFCHCDDESEIEGLRESTTLVSELYEGPIRIKSNTVAKAKEDKLKRLLVKDRQQAAFQQFVGRQHQEPKHAVAPQRVAEVKATSSPILGHIPRHVVEGPSHFSPPHKRTIYEIETKISGHDCKIKFQFYPKQERIVIRAKAIHDETLSTTTTMEEVEFRKLIGATEDVALLEFTINDGNAKAVVETLKLERPITHESEDNFIGRLKKFVRVPNMKFRRPKEHEKVEVPVVSTSENRVDIVAPKQNKAERMQILNSVPTTVKGAKATVSVLSSHLVDSSTPVVAKIESELKRKRALASHYNDKEGETHDNSPKIAKQLRQPHALKEATFQVHKRRKVGTLNNEASTLEIPALIVQSADNDHRRLRESLEIAAKKASHVAQDEDEDSPPPTNQMHEAVTKLKDLSSVDNAMKKLRAFVHSGAAIHMYHLENRKDEIDKLYAPRSKSVSIARHCIVVAFLKYIRESTLPLVPHPYEYGIDMFDAANSSFHELLLAVDEELSVCDSGKLRDIQHDIRKCILDDVGALVSLIDKKGGVTEAELETIGQLEAKLAIVCHISQWFRPTQIRSTIFEGTFPALTKRETMEIYKLTFVPAKEKPFLPQFIKNQANLETEFKDLLELLYILIFSFYNSSRSTDKKLRYFTLLAPTQAERVQTVLQAIEERQGKLLDIQLAFSDVTSDLLMKRVRLLLQCIPRAKVLVKDRSCKLPSFLANLATFMTGSHALFQLKLVTALASNNNIHNAQSLRFIMEMVKSHALDTVNVPNSLANYLEEALGPRLGLDKINIERVKAKHDRLTLSGELCASVWKQSNTMAAKATTLWKARWDSKSNVTSDGLDRYLFKAESECISEFIVLLPTPEPVQQDDAWLDELDVSQRLHAELEEHVKHVATVWTNMLDHKKKDSFNHRAAFGLNLRRFEFLTSNLLSSANLAFFLSHPAVRHVAVGYAVAHKVLRVQIRFYGPILAPTTQTSRIHAHEPNAFNDLLQQIAESDGEHVSVFILQRGIHFIMENLLDVRQVAWGSLALGGPFYDLLIEDRLLARFSEAIMKKAMTKLLITIADNTSLLSHDLLQLLMDTISRANNCCGEDDPVMSLICFFGTAALRLFQIILKVTVATTSTTSVLEMTSMGQPVELEHLNQKQKNFVACKGMVLLDAAMTAPSFSRTGILMDDTPTYQICHKLIIDLLLTHEFSKRPRALIVHHKFWLVHFIADVRAEKLDAYVNMALQSFSDVLQGFSDSFAFSTSIVCDCGCGISVLWNIDMYESVLKVYLDLIQTRSGSRWAQEKNMTGILSLLKMLNTSYVKAMPPQSITKTTILRTIYALAQKIKLADNLVKFFEVVPAEIIAFFNLNSTPSLEIEIFRLFAMILHFGLQRKVPQLSIAVYATNVVEIASLVVGTLNPHVMDIIPPLWSDVDLSDITFKSSHTLRLIAAEHEQSLVDESRNGTPSLLVLFVTLIDARFDKSIQILHFPAIIGLCCMLYDKDIAEICIKENVLVRLLDVHECSTTLYISTKQQYCIWAVSLLCSHVVHNSSLSPYLTSQTLKRILQHSYSSLGMINRSRSTRLDHYVQQINKNGFIGPVEPPREQVSMVGKKKEIGNDTQNLMSSLNLQLKMLFDSNDFNTLRRGSSFHTLNKVTKGDRLLEWEENLETAVSDRDDRTSTLYFILMNAVSCMTTNLIQIKGSDEIKVICRSIVGYFIAEELNPPEYFVATYCFALRNIVFAVCRQSNLNELWEKQTLNVFLKKLFGFIQQKRVSTTGVCVGQEFSVELLWGLLMITKGKETWFLYGDEVAVPMQATPLVAYSSPTPEISAKSTPQPLDRVKLKTLVECAGSQDLVVAEYACASLAILMQNHETALYFMTEFGFSRALMLVQQFRNKSQPKSPQYRKANPLVLPRIDLEGKWYSRELYGSHSMYDEGLRLNREGRAFVQLVRFVANSIRIVSKDITISNDYITTSEKVIKDTFVLLLHRASEPFVLVEVLRGLRSLIKLSSTTNFDCYFNRSDFDHLRNMCFDSSYTPPVQAMALKCSRLLLSKYTTTIPLCRMMFDERGKVVTLLDHSNLRVRVQAIHLMLEIAMTYINPVQMRLIADDFNTPTAKNALSAMLNEFSIVLQDPKRKEAGQGLMDILIRLIIQLDLLSFVNDDCIIDAICNMIHAVTGEAQLHGQDHHVEEYARKPLRPMLCTSLAKVICKGGNAKWFLKAERLDALVAVLGQDSTLTELIDLVCILFTICKEESAIALYLGKHSSHAILHICHVLGGFYELQMVNCVESEKGSIDIDEQSPRAPTVENQHDVSQEIDGAIASLEVGMLKKFRTMKKRLLLKVYFQKTEELKISRHMYKIYKYCLLLLNVIFEAHNCGYTEVYGCTCKTKDGCYMCTPSDLLRKANGGETLRWLLLSKRIRAAKGIMYNSVPDREANCIVFNVLRILKAACFNHLFRQQLLDATSTKKLSCQGSAMLLKLRDICGDTNNPFVTKKKGCIIDAVVVVGQLCSEDGVREFMGVTADISTHLFSIINDRIQVQVPCMLRACLFALCRVAGSEAVVSSKHFKRTIRLTCSLLTMESVVSDKVCFNNIMLFCRNIIAFGKQDVPLIHEYLTGPILALLGRTMQLTTEDGDEFIESNLRLVGVDTLCYLLFNTSIALRHALTEEQGRLKPHDLKPPEPKRRNTRKLTTATTGHTFPVDTTQEQTVFAKMGKIWQLHLQNMNADELSNLGSLDDKLIHVYYALYGAKNETQLFLDILKIHACSKTTQPDHRRESLAHTTELTPVGPKGPDPLPLFFLLEHSTPADLRNFTFAGANHVPGSPLSWKVLRKLMATIKLKGDLEISQSHLLAVLELLAVCQPDGLRNLSRSSHWWLIELESEFIRFVHDIVHQNQFLQASGDTLNLSYKTALRYFHSAFAHEKASDSFSKHFRGFVILHAYSNHTPTMQKLAQMMANVPEIAPESANEGVMDENAIPALVTECLSGMRLGKRRVTWKKRDHGKQPFSMTYYVTEVSHSKVLPYSLGVLKALNDHDARFLSWFLKLDGLDILVEILDLELEYECAAVIPSRLYVLLTTLQLLKDSILLHPDTMDVLAANPRIFLRLFDLTSHVKTQVKQIAMALIAELTSTPWICQGVYSMQVFEELPVFGNADSTVLEQKLKQLKAIFGATVIESDGGHLFVDTNTMIDVKKYAQLSNVRFFRMLKPVTLVKLTKALDSWPSFDSKNFMVCHDGRAATMPLWLVEQYVSDDIIINSNNASYKRAKVLDVVSRMGAKLATTCNMATDKGHRLTRDDYMSSVDAKERKLVANSIWKTINACIGTNEHRCRLRFTQQIFRILIEDQARLLRTKRQSSASSSLLVPHHVSLELFGFLRKCSLLRSLDMEQIGAMCRRIPMPQAFSPVTMTDLIVVCRGTVTVSYKPTMFSFQLAKSVQWKRSFGRGEIVWCPKWISTDTRIEGFDHSRYQVHASPNTTAYVWTYDLHRRAFSSDTLTKLSADISKLFDAIESGDRHLVWTKEMSMFAYEESQLRLLQVHSLCVLGHLSQVPEMALILVKDSQLINFIVMMALSSLDDKVVIAAFQTLRRFCNDPSIAQELMNIKLDIFQGHSVLHGILNAIDIWSTSGQLTSEVIVLLRQVYKLVPGAAVSIPSTWKVRHHEFFHQCLVAPDKELHRHLTAMVCEVLRQSPSIVKNFTDAGLHVGFARLLNSCDGGLLCDVLHLMLLFCLDEPTRRMLWAERTFHRGIKPVLCKMSVELEEAINLDRDKIYCDFFNLLLDAERDQVYSRAYRHFFGSNTTLVSTLTHRILKVELSPDHQFELAMCMECLWRLCYEHEGNAKQVARSCDETDIIDVLGNFFERSHRHTEFQIAVLLLIRSLCTDPLFATKLCVVGLQQQLLEFVLSPPANLEASIPRTCAALHALGSAFLHSTFARKALTIEHILPCIGLLSHSSAKPEMLCGVQQLLRFACMEPPVRQLVWDHHASSSALGWKPWMNTIEQSSKMYLKTCEVAHRQIELHTLGLIAELCEVEDIARSFCTYDGGALPRSMFDLAVSHASSKVVHQILRILVTVAEFMHAWADPHFEFAKAFENRCVMRLKNTLGNHDSNAMVVRFLWLWEMNSSHPMSSTLFGNNGHRVYSNVAEVICKRGVSDIERTMFMGYMRFQLDQVAALNCGSTLDVRFANTVSGHVCSSLRHFAPDMPFPALRFAPDNVMSYFSWSRDRQFIPHVQNWLLMEVALTTLRIMGSGQLQASTSFRHLVEIAIAHSIEFIQSLDSPTSTSTSKQILLAAFGLLAHSKSHARCQSVLLFRKIELLLVDAELSLVIAVLTSLQSLLGHNPTLCFWLSKTNLNFVERVIDILNMNTDKSVEAAGLSVMQVLVARCYRFAVKAIRMDVPFLCIRRSMLESSQSTLLWLRLLEHLVAICGTTHAFEKVDTAIRAEFCQFLVSRAAMENFNLHSNWSSWVASIAMLAGAVVVHEQLVMHWTSTGSFFVSSLLKAILGKPDEDGDRAKKCYSLLMTLLESRHKPLVQHIVNMHSDLEEVVKCAFSFRPSPSKLHAVQVTLVCSVLNHLAMDIHATMLFANISEYFSQYDSFPPSCRHVCFEILTSTLAAKLPHRHPKTPLLRDVLATLAWGKVVKDVLNGIRSSSYHVQLSSLRLLDALLTYSTQCTLRELDVMEISVLQATLSEILDGFTNNTCVDTRLEEVCRSSASSIANCSTAFDVPFDVPLRQCRRAVYAKPSRAKETVNENEANLYQNHGAVYFFALKCIQVLDMDAKSITVHNISPMTSNFDWGCSFVVYRTVNADMFDADSVHAMLLLLYSGILHSGGGNGNSDVVANDPFMHCLLRFAGSHAYLQLRQMATALFWKLLHCADASIVSAICTLVSQFKFCLLRNLHENLTLVEPLIGATLTAKDAWKDLLLTTCGLLCEFCVDAAMSASIASRNYIRDILALLQADRPNQLNAMNIQFLTMIERMIQSGFTSLHLNNRGLLPHCLQCLALDNSEALRSQAVYVLYLFCQEMTGLDLLKTTVFPHVANPSTHASKVAADESTNNELQAGIHMYALSESLKCNQPRPQRAAMYLVCELCADPHHAAALRMCRQSSSSLINLVAHVLAATLGTTHRNRVQFRGVVDVSETDARFTFVTGCYALQCLQRLDVFADVFSDVVCGNKVMVQLFAALGWANSEVCRPAVALLCGIYQYALKSKVEQKSQFGPKENSSDEGIDLAILTGQSRDHLLNRMKCFRHKVATQIPSYIKLLADWVSWFCAHRPLSHADVLSSILELISTSVQLFFPTIYFPIHATTRVHHQTLLENVFDIAFGQHDHVLGEAAASVHMEALGVLANLCNHTEYACARFESPSAMKMLLDCTERSTGRLQRVAGQLLQAVTKHQSVKECIYSNKLMSFMSWINLPNFDPILGNLLHAVKNLIEKPTTPSPHYDATTIATLLLKATPTQCQNLPPATNFRRMQLRLSVKYLNANTIVMNPTFTARIDHDDNVTILRRVYVPSSLHVELSWLHSIDVRNITVHLELSSPGHDTIFVHHACGFDTPTTFSGHDSAYSIEGHVSDVSATDLQSLTGPLGEVLKFCVQEKKLPELGLLSALIGELCKHDEVFCNVDLNLWCFIAYLLQNGSATGGNSQGMQCLKAIAATASAQHKHLKTFVSHVMFMIQLLDIYGMSSSKIQLPDDRSGHHIGHPHCMRNKESILFMVAVADMVASYGSVSFVENVMRQLFIEHCGVVMFLCGEHRGKEHSCSGYFFIQTHFIRLLPSHPILLSQDCFVQTNLRHFVECAHSSDDCVKHATKMMLHIVSNSIACQQFVLHNGLHLLGRVAQILMNNNLTKGTRHFAPALCQIVLVASFLSANILSQVPLPLEFERLFFPSAVSKDVMPFLEILLWPLMPVDGAFTWTESSLLAAKVLSDVMEKRSSRLLLENHLIHISFRLSQSRVLLVQAALATCLDCTAWDQKHAVDVIQRVYFVAVRKGIKLGMLSAECTELLPQTSKSEQDVSHRSHKSIMAQSSTKLNVVPAKTEGRPMHETLNPYRDQLLYCLNFTEQHREGRLRDILVRSRKKGISDMLSAVNNSARVLVLIHQVLEMFFETYVSVVSAVHIEYSDVKVKKMRFFCKQLESIAAVVVAALNQMEASYFGVIFAQLHDIRVPNYGVTDPVECRNTMRSNMKKLLFILKRIIDKKKLKPLLDEQSFVEAEEIMGSIRLDFAVNGRRRLGHAALDNASIADFLCEAAELGGLKKFDEFIAGTRYLYARSMLRDDGTVDNLEDFMMGTSDNMTLKEAIKELINAILTQIKTIFCSPFRLARRMVERFASSQAAANVVSSSERSNGSIVGDRARRHNSTLLTQAHSQEMERRLMSPFPFASVFFCHRHEQAARVSVVWKVLRQVGLLQTAHAASSASFPVLLKPNFAEDFLAGLLSKRQELIIDHLLNPENAIHDDVLERKLTSTEIHIVMLNIENFLARQDNDIALYYVHPSTLPVNVWNFVVSPVYHTRLMHAHYLLNDLKSADSLASAQALWQTLEKGHSFVTQAIRLSPMMKLKTTKRKMSQKHASAPFVRRKSWCPWKWHKPSPDGGDYDGASLNTDEIRRKPMGVLYTNYILPVCDRQLDDPLSDQMAWEHLIGEINAGKYPPWVFRINDSVCSPHLRRATKVYRSLLRGIIYLTFWRLEEYFLDLQDRSWPEGEVIRLTCTSRKCLEEDIVESIVIYKHFKKAMSELFRVWMLESGSLGLPLWQHWGYFVGGCIFPAVVLFIYLPTLLSYTDYSARDTDYHMKWLLAGFFSLLFTLVMWSIVLLVKKTENFMVQERQQVRYFPVTRHYSNYLALFGLFSEMVQHNSIPFSEGVKWASGYKLPTLVNYIGQLGITNFDFFHIESFNLAYLKSFFASGILVLFLVVLKCANKFHKTYPALNQRLTKDLPPIVSGLLFVGIVNSFSSLLFCCTCDQYVDNPAAQEACYLQRNGSNEPFLYSYPDLNFTCWSPEHKPLAYVGLMGSTFFIPIGILGAGMSQVLFPLETLDIKFSPIIDLTSQLTKTITAISALFFTFRTQYMISIGFGLNLLLFAVTLVNKTSSIWYIGTVKSVIYIMSVWTSLCAFVNILLDSPSSGPIYYLNVGWFAIMCLACCVLGIRLRFRNMREERARRERLRDYQLLNDTSELSRLTDMEEDMLRRATKPLSTEQLEATAPKGFMDAAMLKAHQLGAQELPAHLEEFMRLAKKSAENPTTSELMFKRRAKRLGHRIAAFEELERLSKHHGHKTA
ncbi:hypothetical protein H310_00505 [Aphanomyces invadans]|uniref:Uncharacterized protein n=1 Tax=Aphanomyces invadans TaxID=157072 RepID=A0A024UWS0_9STRA|nr:hypothetical protein H310_00505 [Aphanomyces invadans]ETW10133.1 hypothetical protein H310_00505 [Aphanomyces invadans]|eukprot:XP_008861544.1 hypothetical protein H310_00505 [Aphanomyces invadans]